MKARTILRAEPAGTPPREHSHAGRGRIRTTPGFPGAANPRMLPPMEKLLRIPLTAGGAKREVSGVLIVPRGAQSCLVLAHGAGAGMHHPFMADVAQGLALRGVATLRYQFPSMEDGSRRPDRPPLAHAAVRAAVAAAARHTRHTRHMRLFAGGKSFGGRMTSQAQALEPLTGVAGLVFLGFPLHPPGKASLERAEHLLDIEIPMLFVHGARDALAEPDHFRRSMARLGFRGTAMEVDGADHSFHVPRRSGCTDMEVLDGILDTITVWMQAWQL